MYQLWVGSENFNLSHLFLTFEPVIALSASAQIIFRDIETVQHVMFNLFGHKATHNMAVSHRIPHPSPSDNVLSKNTLHRDFRNPVHGEPFSLVQLASQWVVDRHSL